MGCPVSAAAVFAVVAVALAAGHWTGDYWIQTNSQAAAKGRPGWPGRLACAAHVATYTLALAACLAAAAAELGVPVTAGHAAAGLAVSAVTHYYADRRGPLRRLAAALGKGGYWDNGGSAPLDQAWHWWWLFVSALVIAGRWA